MSDRERERLPNKRPHEVREFEHGGFRYVAGIGRFGDGKVGEIFLTTSAKGGSVLDAWSRDAAIVTSLALQHGVGEETLRKALTRDERGRAAGPVGELLDILASDRDDA